MENIREIAECIVEALSTESFDEITCSSGYFVIKEFEDGIDRAVDVYKSTNDGKPHYVIYCSYEDEDFDYMYTDDLSVEQLESKLIEFYMVQHKKHMEWFGEVKWCKDDLKIALCNKGYPVTENNVEKLYTLCNNHWFTDYMIEMGWQYIYDMIGTGKGFDKSE